MFSVFFFANVFLIAAWGVLAMLQRPAVSGRVLRRLRSWDEQFCPAGLPVLSLALRTFVLRDAADRWQAEHTFVSLERKCVEEEETSLRARLAAVAQDRGAPQWCGGSSPPPVRAPRGPAPPPPAARAASSPPPPRTCARATRRCAPPANGRPRPAGRRCAARGSAP